MALSDSDDDVPLGQQLKAKAAEAKAAGPSSPAAAAAKQPVKDDSSDSDEDQPLAVRKATVAGDMQTLRGCKKVSNTGRYQNCLLGVRTSLWQKSKALYPVGASTQYDA